MTPDPRHQERIRHPQLPHGTPTTLSGLSETFSFHSSPESFIASRVLAFQTENPQLFDSRAPVRAKILNRDVAVISSHAQVLQILSSTTAADGDIAGPTAVAVEAYKPFMADFFPSPNLLLADGPQHEAMRGPWKARMKTIDSRTREIVSQITTKTLNDATETEFDLYEFSKKLVWKILLGVFLDLNESDPEFEEIERLQEDLLRGQFSLFPVSINVRWWQSPRSRGIVAKEKLRDLLLERLRRDSGACPFRAKTTELEEVANHLLLFTSSLAVKAIASLMTPYLMNLFLFDRAGVPLAEEVSGLGDPEATNLLRSILLETERLSPPIVGIMRKMTRDTILPSTSADSSDVLIPKGWDAWLYFVGGGRDPSAFGRDWAYFQPDRFLNRAQDVPCGLAFSAGNKQCLGQDLVRDTCVQVAQIMLRNDLRLIGENPPAGVRAWLGWEGSENMDAASWARDMKQLPTQRPAKAIRVRLTR
jgi:cytochrome P450